MSVFRDQSVHVDRVPIRSRRRWLVPMVVGLAGVSLMSNNLWAMAADDEDRAIPKKDDVVQVELDSLVEQDGFPGALAAVATRDGKGRNYVAGVGNLETGEKVPADGQVRIASNTKAFTATVVLQLVGERKVDLDAPIETYLPGLVRGEGIDGNAITVRQVLQHTSGIPEFVLDVYTDPTDPTFALGTYFEPHQLLDFALSRPADFAPGTQWQYSNTNYILAGLLIQQVTGNPVGQEITDRIIEPLDLEDTYWPKEGELTLREDHPRGYALPRPNEDGSPGTGSPVDVTDQDTSAPWAAGALVSTPSELLEFFTALIDGELLSAEMLAEMQTTVPAPGSSIGGDEAYGLGLQTFTLSCGGTAWAHGGDISGTETRGAVTADGRGVMLAVTAGPTTLEAASHVEDAVDAALCQ